MMKRFLFLFALAMTITVLAAVEPVLAGPGLKAGTDASATPSGGTFFANSPQGTWSYTNAAGVVDPFALGSSNSGTPLRKFIDALPVLCSFGTNSLGQCLPVAVPAASPTGDNADYYEIGLKQYTERMHSDLPKATTLRGYYQINTADPFANTNHYLGPIIVAHKNKPVRIKFVNQLGLAGTPQGDLFIPVDRTYMGAGKGPDGVRNYPDNRASLHLHGGHTPWISDGTPHQWITPAGESATNNYLKGDSQQNVPDMADPGAGAETLYWTNNQSGRLLFYHDHALGITRLNVYAGMAAGYLIVDAAEEDSLAAAGVPGTIGTTPDLAHMIPLIIQDKSYVPQDIAVQDTKWMTNPNWGTYGDLWFPHVYETNQWPSNPDLSGANNFGRWDYGPWFWPVFPVQIPGLPTMDVTGVPEGFMDTPVINGTAYPFMNVDPTAYRFQILNAANDRMWNLSLFTADTSTGAYISPDTGLPTEVKMVPAIPRPACSATVTTNCVCAPPTYAPAGCFPSTWPVDARPEGVPDPANMGPPIVQIGNESGVLPQAVVIDPQPIDYEYNRRNIVVLNVTSHSLFLGPAERADVVIDFKNYAGKTVILYNDSPAPVPAFDPRFDYYTGDADNTWMGGAPSTLPGFGPNTRTIMQFRVSNNVVPDLFSVPTLTAAMPNIYLASQAAPVVPETAYPGAYHATTDTYSRISDNYLTFTNLATGQTVTQHMLAKTIQELFTPDYGRMNATLGTELPFTNALTQTTIPLGYIDPPTEIVANGKPQIWKITHNGVDTHAIHFHLFDVQVINRVGWDGAIRPPDANEIGWKDVVRMNPLEDIIVALRPSTPPVPFAVPNSLRAYDVTQPLGVTTKFTGIDPYTGAPVTVTNQIANFGWEYVWHCHLLGHEENDMMRPIVLNVNDVSDLIWRDTTTGTVAAWPMDGTTNLGYTDVGTAPLEWVIAGIGDFNGDGQPDILWRNTSTGVVAIWAMNGLTNTGYAEVGSAPLEWTIAGVGDFNGDNKPDILWRNTTTGVVAVWTMNGMTNTGYVEIGYAPLEWRIGGVGDLNGDGKPDIVWNNTTTGAVGVWIMNGVTNTGYVDIGSRATNFTIVGVRDFNGDVYPDILWRDTTTGAVDVWTLKGTTLLGTASIGSAPTNWTIGGLM